MLDLLTDLLSRARARGASEADAFLTEEEESSVQVRLRRVDTVKHSREQRLSLRVFSEKAAAAASTSDLSRASVEKLVDEAIGLARITTPDPLAGLPEREELAPLSTDLDLHDPDGHGLSPEERIELARRAEAAALDADPRVTNSEGSEFYERRATHAYATSDGFFGSYRTSGFSLTVSPVVSSNGEMQRESWYSIARKRARLDPPEEVGRIAARRALRRLGARKVKTCEVPVVFDPEMASSLLRNLSSAISGYSLYKGASFLIGKLATKIASESVTVIDDGTIPGALGSRPFDGEGLPIKRKLIVDKGQLQSYLLDTYSGKKLGMASTGNASRSVGEPPGVAPANFYLAPGTHTPEEIIGSVKAGLYVTELIGFGVNMVTGDYSRGAAGLWIENGELAFPVEEITIAGNLKEMFQNLEMVGNDLEMRGRIAAPTVKIARMTVAGN